MRKLLMALGLVGGMALAGAAPASANAVGGLATKQAAPVASESGVQEARWHRRHRGWRHRGWRRGGIFIGVPGFYGYYPRYHRRHYHRHYYGGHRWRHHRRWRGWH